MIVNTIYGEMDDSELEKKTGEVDNENETTIWVEYWKDDELVHRSVHVTLKPVASEGVATSIGG